LTLATPAAGLGPDTGAQGVDVAADSPFPLGERLHYSVHWLGMTCGSMTLESYAVPAHDDTAYVIVMTAQSSKFFDGVYRVRSRIESRYSRRLDSSVRYHSVSEERKDIKDELYEFDVEADTLVRVKNGTQQEFELGADHVHDPLAYVFKLRRVEGGVGDSTSLVLATTKGPLETVARIERQKLIRTEFGKRQALKVVPEPKDGMLFSRSGRMELWVGTDPERTLYRIEFDLAFGKLTAVLERREPLDMKRPAQSDSLRESEE
jgi:hypothetical protein